MEYIIGAVIGLLVGAVLVYVFGVLRERKQAEEDLNSARNQAKQIVNEAYKSAENKKREAMVEAKEEILKARNEYEQEEKERRADLQKQERRLQQKEENLDRKTENMEKKEEHLSNRLAKLEATQAEAEQLKQEQVAKLEEISGFTAEEAKAYLLDQLEADVTHESAMKIKEIEARFKDEADTKAREIISLAIQRCAADHALRRRPRGRGHGVCGPPAQRRDEGPHHRPRGPQHPHPGDPDRGGPDHRRHAGGHHRLLL